MTPEHALIEKLAKAAWEAHPAHVWESLSEKSQSSIRTEVCAALRALAEAGCTEGMVAAWNAAHGHTVADGFEAMLNDLLADEEKQG